MQKKYLNKNILFFYGIILLFIVIRLFYYIDISHSPFMYSPSIDSKYHYDWALGILNSNWGSDVTNIPNNPFFRAPLYPYIVAMIFKIFHTTSLKYVFIFQSLLNLTSLCFVYFLTKKIFGEISGLIGALLFTLSGTILYYETELLIPTLIVFLNILAIFFVIKSKHSTHKKIYLIVSGILIGLSAIARPNILITIPAFLYLLIDFKKRDNLSAILIFSFSFIAPILPITIHNYIKSNEFIPIATQGGINFYIGNNDKSDGKSALVPELKYTDWQYSSALKYAENDLNKKLKPNQHSAYWYDKGFHYIQTHPFKWAMLLMKKTYLWHFNNIIPNNHSPLTFADNFSKILKYLLFINFGLFAPFVIFSFVSGTDHLSLQKNAYNRKIKRFLKLFYLLYTASFMLFFVTSRYRLPLTFLGIIFIFESFSILKSSYIHKKGFKLHLLVLIAIIIFTNINWFEFRFSNKAQDMYSIGTSYLNLKDYGNAKIYYRKAFKLNKKLSGLNLNLGNSFYYTAKYDSAVYYYRNEKDLHGKYETQALKNMKIIADIIIKQGNTYSSKNEIERGIKLYKKAYQIYKTPDALFNTAVSFGKIGQNDSAYKYLKQSVEIDSSFAPAKKLLEKIEKNR